MKKVIKGIISAILSLIMIILIYFIVANIVATKNNSIAKFFGYSISYVPTGSMEPTISANSTIIFDQDYKYSDLKVDDIIVYYNDETNMYIIHRIIDSTDDGFITKGDNNSIADYHSNSLEYYYVTESNYIGKYTTTITVFSLNSNFSKGCVIVLIVLAVSFIGASEIFSLKKKSDFETKHNEIDQEELKKELLEELKEEYKNKNTK